MNPIASGRRLFLHRVARLGAGAAVAATAALGAGCVVAPLYDGGPYEPVEGPVADSAPPMPQYEVAPAAPGGGYVWLGGYWAWNLNRYVWVGGRWAVPPPGRVWAPGYWSRHGQGWRWRGGYWRRR